MPGKRAIARWVRETWGGERKSASRRTVARMDLEKEGFCFLNMEEGWRSNNIDKAKSKKVNSEMKGVVKERMWVVLGKKEKEQRE